VPALEELNPEKCYTGWNVLLATDKGINDIKDVFIFVEDSCRIEIRKTECDFNLNENESQIIKFLTDNPGSDPALLNAILNPAYMPVVQEESKQEDKEAVKTGKSQPSESYQSIRVSSDKLDILVNLVGELVTLQARLAQTVNEQNHSKLQAVSEEIERITWDLRDNALNIRMMPVGGTFTKFKRLIRDLSQELGKEVELVIEGAETELDKNVIEKLNDPLVHIIRNSIDHGIEMPEERLWKGKPAKGRLMLSAQHSGMHVLIKISDDGAGMNKETILNKAREKGLVAPDAELSEKEILNLIFAPGFSTAKEVTSVSGRGVGMDVVKRALDNLRGSIEVASTLGEGTSIVLKLPLTLAIIEGLLVDVSGDNFIIPLNLVEECLELTKEDVKKANGKQLARVRGELVPYISLREKFSIEGEPSEVQQIVVVVDDGRRTGFLVDKVIGEHQTVLKSLGKFYENVDGVSGATILGDGTVALILDVQRLVQLAIEMEKQIY
jgi:two-component system chemotaxis sensor kinase CheA